MLNKPKDRLVVVSVTIDEMMVLVSNEKKSWDIEKQYEYAERCLESLHEVSIQEAIQFELQSQVKMMIEDVE